MNRYLPALLAALIVNAGTPPTFARSGHQHSHEQRSEENDLWEEEEETEELERQEREVEESAAAKEEWESKLRDLGLDPELDTHLDFDDNGFDPDLDDAPEPE